MEVVIIDENIFVMVEVRFKFKIFDIGLLDASDGVELNKRFTLDGTLFSVNKFLLNISGNFIDVVVDILHGLIFDDEVGSFFGTDSCDSFDIVAAIPY